MARGLPNTPVHVYLDTPEVRRACEKDFNAIRRACKPEDERNHTTKKRTGIAGKVSRITERLDNLGKTGYRRTAANAWMDDHCSGLWVKPPQTNNLDQFPTGLREQIDGVLEQLGDLGTLDWLGMLVSSLDDMVELALEHIPEERVARITAKLAAKTGIKVGIGTLGAPTVVVSILMALWTAYDIYSTVQELAGLMGDAGAAALQAFESIWDLGDKVEEIVNDMVREPGKAYTNLMSLFALMDACIRARKCLLVKYKDQNDRDGTGCCPGQTGHHLIPDAAAKSAGCTGYHENNAPVMCLEGTRNNAGWGTHGNAHQALKERLRSYRERRAASGLSPNTISYNDMANNAVDAVRLSGAALQCDKDCLLAQLRAYYNCPNSMPPNDGTGSMPQMPEPGGDENTR